MKVLIVGASGLLGRCLAGLLREGHEVFALDRDAGTFHGREHPRARFIQADLSVFDPSGLPPGVDAVYYLAQSRRFREFPAGAMDMFEINVHAPLRIAEWAADSGVARFHYASTGGVYENREGPIPESATVNVRREMGFYAGSKVSAELLLANYASRFESFCIIRPFFVYGPGQDEGMLIPRLIRSVSDGREIVLHGEEGMRINPIYVQDAARACGRMLDLTGDHLFNVAGTEVVSIKALALRIGEACGREPAFRHEGEGRPGLIGDISRMQEMLHRPEIDLREGIRATCEGMAGERPDG